jgi:hypothetical protein
MKSSGKWVELETTVLSEISQFHKDKYCVISAICGLEGKHTCTHTHTHTHTLVDNWGGGKRGEKKEQQLCEHGQRTLHACMEMSQGSKPLTLYN